MSPADHLLPEISAVRRFNRFYTQQIGVLRGGLLASPYSLTEVRVLYELAHASRPLAFQIARELGLDAGYLSRVLRKFEKQGLVRRKASGDDARQNLISLTAKGRTVFAGLDINQNREVESMLSRIGPARRHQLLAAMGTIQRALSEHDNKPAYILRTHQPGDMGWVTHRHGVLYWQEYGWDERFEALVAQIVARFVQNFDRARERCWIAERDGEIVGSIFVVKKSASVAKLRLLLVEPSARGLGIGGRLVDEAIRFARNAGYKKMTLWTQNNLHSARKIYQAAGFKLSQEEPNRDFGKGLKAQTWDLEL
jgi:DNA-binding MarR family transcriptional regulator/N-acetylglutamate synthase-like GNAT family acetyltransferase